MAWDQWDRACSRVLNAFHPRKSCKLPSRVVPLQKIRLLPIGLAHYGTQPRIMASDASKFLWAGHSAVRAEARPPVLQRGTVLAALLACVGYYVGSQIGFALTFRPHPVSVLWPPNSILLAVLLLTPVRTWWLMLLAAFPAPLLAPVQSPIPPTRVFFFFCSHFI